LQNDLDDQDLMLATVGRYTYPAFFFSPHSTICSTDCERSVPTGYGSRISCLNLMFYTSGAFTIDCSRPTTRGNKKDILGGYSVHDRPYPAFSADQRTKRHYSRVKNGLLPRIRTFREITFFMLCVTRIFKSYFECLRLVTLN
jgi:hypothetical protein